MPRSDVAGTVTDGRRTKARRFRWAFLKYRTTPRSCDVIDRTGTEEGEPQGGVVLSSPGKDCTDVERAPNHPSRRNGDGGQGVGYTKPKKRGKDSQDLTSVKLMMTDNKPAIALLDMI